MNKRFIKRCTVAVLFFTAFTAAFFSYTGWSLVAYGAGIGNAYVELGDAVQKAGFVLVERDDGSITYKSVRKGEPAVAITFDVDRRSAVKNEFVFDLSGKIKRSGDRTLIDKSALEDVLSVSVSLTDGVVSVSSKNYAAHYWTQICYGLVAHAGGCADAIELGGNSREALVLSYNSGHRVFEFDFNFTSDGKVAVVHDWVRYKGAKTSAEWAKTLVYGNLTSMMLDDLLDFMMVNKDMFIVTDAKVYDCPDEQVTAMFRAIVESAKKKDPTLGLLNRIIPQIYNRPMYNIVVGEYKFPSIIYTLYESPDSDKEVLDFVKKHEEIKAVTMLPWKANKIFVKNLNDAGKYVYLHAINGLDEIKAYRASGIHGVYTDFAYPTPAGIAVHTAPELRVNGSQPSDSPARLNGEVIPSILIDGEPFVFVADLVDYGFKTVYNDKTREMIVTYDKNKKVTGAAKSRALGGDGFTWVYSDIRAVVDGARVERSYHINGYIAVPLSAVSTLAKFPEGGSGVLPPNEPVPSTAPRLNKITCKWK